MKIFIICSVRIATPEYEKMLYEYVDILETDGHKVHLPVRDTEQKDETGGYIICEDNAAAIASADEIHISYNEKSLGTHFDLGVAFALDKKIHIFDQPEIDEKQSKSFLKMIRYWESISEDTIEKDN
jgi:nucleoside 2-deoxyribosyltransferase